MKPRAILQRFLAPQWFTTLFLFLKYRCLVSLRAEVELSPNLVIGRGTQISSFCKIKAPYGPVRIGRNVSIGPGCFISSHTEGVEIGDDCLVGPNVSLVAGNYRYDKLDVPIRMQGGVSKGIAIGEDVWVGAGVCILDGVTVGSGAIIAANSLVSTDVPDRSIVQGNPAKVIFKRR